MRRWIFCSGWSGFVLAGCLSGGAPSGLVVQAQVQGQGQTQVQMPAQAPVAPVGVQAPVIQQGSATNAATSVTAVGATAEGLPVVAPKAYDKPQIQIALLLDVSGSMSGLLNQARSELWKVVNALTDVTREGVEPEVRVSLYSYGMSDSEDGLYIQQEIPLTMDLDSVSEKLFALSTDGSAEYCGTVIQAASQGLEWTLGDADLKAVIIAGNEPFTQGPVSPEGGIERARERSIHLHTVYCGDAKEGIDGGWKRGATQGKGSYLSIDHNATEVHVDAPQDDEIVELGVALNKTYVPYGKKGREGVSKQRAQDSNAKKMSKSSVVQRSLTKSGKYYKNNHWDLVDGVKSGKVKLKDLDVNALPEEMKGMSPSKRAAHLEGKERERQRIKTRMKELKRARGVYVAAEKKKRTEEVDTLASAMIEALRAQAVARGFTWPVDVISN
ncbi:MAG: vWA domain-containing protein [Myxococcota bacterium]|nr:vWA domain-containing protein [Myxococcota bacterium]